VYVVYRFQVDCPNFPTLYPKAQSNEDIKGSEQCRKTGLKPRSSVWNLGGLVLVSLKWCLCGESGLRYCGTKTCYDILLNIRDRVMAVVIRDTEIVTSL
jgi:hypothetical protein